MSKESDLMVEKIFAQIFSLILAQEFKPGERLSVDELSRRFGVSQTPIRQALTRLQADELVVNRRNAGFRVSDLPSQSHLVEILEFRLMFEDKLAAAAARNVTDDVIENLKVTLDMMEEQTSSGEVEIDQLFRADREFHCVIAIAAGNSSVASNLERLLLRSSVFRLRYNTNVPLEILEEHRRIAQAIADRDADEAGHRMREHLQISVNRVKNALML